MIHPPHPVKLIIGVLAASQEVAQQARDRLENRWGPVDARSEAIPFHFTDYYKKEMGPALLRQWLGFERLVAPGNLAKIKKETNRMEEVFSPAPERRQVNLDPGYLTLASLVLASTKDFSHRIYLSGGIYGEVTLLFRDKQFAPLPWTYPDYKSKTALLFLEQAREKYHSQLFP